MWVVSVYCFVFLFKQKTAYEMRISDWSSDVCSSDLDDRGRAVGHGQPQHAQAVRSGRHAVQLRHRGQLRRHGEEMVAHRLGAVQRQLGRSEERRVGTACVSKCISRWSPYHTTKTQTEIRIDNL